MSALDVIRGFVSGSGKTAAEQTSPPAVAANTAVPSAATPASDGTGPGAMPAVGTGEASPLAGYTKLWDKAETDAKPINPAISFTADPTKIMAAAKQIDISKAIDPALLAKAQTGDTAAIMEMINSSVQVGIAHATQSTTQIVNEALKQQADKYRDEVIPDVLRRHSAQTANRTDNPLFDNPAAAPMLAMAEAQFLQKYPNATAAEIKQNTREFIDQFATLVLTTNGKVISDAPKTSAATSGGVKDWNEWVSAPLTKV